VCRSYDVRDASDPSRSPASKCTRSATHMASHIRRNHGGVLFFDVRDASGLIQVTCVPGAQPEAAAIAERVRQEWVVAVTGVLRPRQVSNANMPTGASNTAEVYQLSICRGVGGGGDGGAATAAGPQRQHAHRCEQHCKGLPVEHL